MRWRDGRPVTANSPAARADSLLRAWLDPEQLRQLDSYGGFLVRGSRGGLYALFPRSSRECVWQLHGGQVRGYFPIYLALPSSDCALATALAIECDEGDLRKRACTVSTESDGRFASEWRAARSMERAASPGGRLAWAIANAGRAYSPYPF